MASMLLKVLTLTTLVGLGRSFVPTVCIQWYENNSCSLEQRKNAVNPVTTRLWQLNYTSKTTDEFGLNPEKFSCSVWIVFNSSLPKLHYFEGVELRNVTSVVYDLKRPTLGGDGCGCASLTTTGNCESISERVEANTAR